MRNAEKIGSRGTDGLLFLRWIETFAAKPAIWSSGRNGNVEDPGATWRRDS
jgi:hypothetical protein